MEERLLECIRTGAYGKVTVVGDYAITIWVATGEDTPVFVTYGKHTGEVAIYQQSYKPISPELKVAIANALEREAKA